MFKFEKLEHEIVSQFPCFSFFLFVSELKFEKKIVFLRIEGE